LGIYGDGLIGFWLCGMGLKSACQNREEPKSDIFNDPQDIPLLHFDVGSPAIQ
jgi:hypothetical protein